MKLPACRARMRPSRPIRSEYGSTPCWLPSVRERSPRSGSSTRIGYSTGCAARNSRVGPGASLAIPTTCRPRAAWRWWKRSSSGISSMQGAHQLAQKLSSTRRPFHCARGCARPSRSGSDVAAGRRSGALAGTVSRAARGSGRNMRPTNKPAVAPAIASATTSRWRRSSTWLSPRGPRGPLRRCRT